MASLVAYMWRRNHLQKANKAQEEDRDAHLNCSSGGRLSPTPDVIESVSTDTLTQTPHTDPYKNNAFMDDHNNANVSLYFDTIKEIDDSLLLPALDFDDDSQVRNRPLQVPGTPEGLRPRKSIQELREKLGLPLDMEKSSLRTDEKHDTRNRMLIQSFKAIDSPAVNPYMESSSSTPFITASHKRITICKQGNGGTSVATTAQSKCVQTDKMKNEILSPNFLRDTRFQDQSLDLGLNPSQFLVADDDTAASSCICTNHFISNTIGGTNSKFVTKTESGDESFNIGITNTQAVNAMEESNITECSFSKNDNAPSYQMLDDSHDISTPGRVHRSMVMSSPSSSMVQSYSSIYQGNQCNIMDLSARKQSALYKGSETQNEDFGGDVNNCSFSSRRGLFEEDSISEHNGNPYNFEPIGEVTNEHFDFPLNFDSKYESVEREQDVVLVDKDEDINNVSAISNSSPRMANDGVHSLNLLSKSHTSESAFSYDEEEMSPPSKYALDNQILQRKHENQSKRKEEMLIGLIQRLQDNLALVAAVEGNQSFTKTINDHDAFFVGYDRAAILANLRLIVKEIEAENQTDYVGAHPHVTISEMQHVTHFELRKALLFVQKVLESATDHPVSLVHEESKGLINDVSNKKPSELSICFSKHAQGQELMRWMPTESLQRSIGLGHINEEGGDTSLFSLPSETTTPNKAVLRNEDNSFQLANTTSNTEGVDKNTSSHFCTTIVTIATVSRKINLATKKLIDFKNNSSFESIDATQEIKRGYLELMRMNTFAINALFHAFALEPRKEAVAKVLPVADVTSSDSVTLDTHEQISSRYTVPQIGNGNGTTGESTGEIVEGLEFTPQTCNDNVSRDPLSIEDISMLDEKVLKNGMASWNGSMNEDIEASLFADERTDEKDLREDSSCDENEDPEFHASVSYAISSEKTPLQILQPQRFRTATSGKSLEYTPQTCNESIAVDPLSIEDMSVLEEKMFESNVTPWNDNKAEDIDVTAFAEDRIDEEEPRASPEHWESIMYLDENDSDDLRRDHGSIDRDDEGEFDRDEPASPLTEEKPQYRVEIPAAFSTPSNKMMSPTTRQAYSEERERVL